MVRPALAIALLVTCATLMAADSLDIEDEARSAPSFMLPATDGSVHRLADYRGRYVLVNFWAVWCSPCRREMPSMQRIYEQLSGEHFELLAIHVGPSLDGARRYAAQLGLTFPILVDEEMDLGSWQVPGLPTTFLLDPQGRIIAKAIGERSWDDPKLLQQLLQLMPAG